MVVSPSPRHFVVVQLDPVDSVAHLDSPELTEACQRLTNKKYLAFVGDRYGLFWPDVPYYGSDFYFVHQGLKYKDENQQAIDPGMCAPVLPNTSHPLGRTPLDPGQPLPWNDCYVSPFFAVEARSHTVVLEKEPTMRLHLNIDDTVRWFGYVNVDCRNRSPPAQSVSLPPRKVHRTDHHDDEDCEDGIHESWNPTSEMERATELEDLLDELEEFDDELMKLAVVRTSFDVTELEQVTDPAEFMAELKAFETLRDELVTRQRRHKVENARRIDDEHFAKLYQSDNHTPTTSGASPLPTPSPTSSVPPKAPASLRARGAKFLKNVGRTMRRIVKFFRS